MPLQNFYSGFPCPNWLNFSSAQHILYHSRLSELVSESRVVFERLKLAGDFLWPNPNKNGVYGMPKFDYNLALYPLQIRPQHIYYEQHYAKVLGNEKGRGWGSQLLFKLRICFRTVAVEVFSSKYFRFL